MAFQYQSVAALSPMMLEHLAITLVDIGILIGLYFGPGVIIALLGGTLATWLGDKRTAIISFVLMIIGGGLMIFGASVETLMAGRLISGVGGVVINVLMTKLVIDWFSGRSLGTAMAIFLNSWPLGIAFAVLLLPLTAEIGGLTSAWFLTASMALLALLLFAPIYNPPEGAEIGSARLRLTSLPWLPLLMISAVWGLYNAGISMIFGFGPLIMKEQGLAQEVASVAVSLFMIGIAVAAPVGGWLSDRFGHTSKIILLTLAVPLAIFPALLSVPDAFAWPAYALAGLVIGLSPGLIVSLPSRFLPTEARSFGMGVFYAGYYVFMTLAPPIAASVSEAMVNIELPYFLGAGFMALGLIAFAGLLRSQR